MTITYPLTFPSPDPYSVRFTISDIVGANASPFTAQQQFYDWQAGFWTADLVMPPMTRTQGASFVAFLASLRGRVGTFMLGDPARATARGLLGGSPLVNGAGQRGYTLALDGATASVTNWLRAGDYVQLGNYLHMVLVNASSDSGGNVSLDLWPRLRSEPADNAPITTVNAKGIWRLATNARSWLEEPGILYREISLALVEAI